MYFLKLFHLGEFQLLLCRVFSFEARDTCKSTTEQRKAVCKNNLQESCNMFLRSLYFRIIIIFLFPDSCCLCKKIASHSDSCSQNNRSKNEISLSIITMIPLLDLQIKYLLLKAKDVELFYITLEFVFNLSISVWIQKLL